MFTLFENATVLTMDAARPRARSLLIQGDRIVALLDEAAPDLTLPGRVRRVDLGGRCLMPAFTDSHIHMLGWGMALSQIDLNGTRSPAEVAERVAAAARTQRGQRGPLVGAGWLLSAWHEPRLPQSTTPLDAIAPDRPVMLLSKCTHLAWVNRAALALAGIDRTMDDPEGGAIERDAHGEPTGVLKENAVRLVRDRLPAPDDATRAAALERATSELHALGVVAVHCLETLDDFAQYRRVAADGALAMRVHFYLPGAALDSLADLNATVVGAPAGRLSIGGLKFFADGSLGGRTAWMSAPYAGEPDNRGVPTLEPDQARLIVRRATDLGLPVAIHAIGDAAVTMVLDAFEEGRAHEIATRAGRPLLAHRIEHFQTVRTEDIARAARLGVWAMMQPCHLLEDWRSADRNLGAERGALSFRLREIVDAGVSVAFGSDAPIETASVAVSLHAGVNRQDLYGRPEGGWHPEQALTVEEMLVAHTWAGARVAGDGERRGRLRAGDVADLVVLDRDPTRIPRADLKSLRVEATFLDGQCVHGGDFLADQRRLANRTI